MILHNFLADLKRRGVTRAAAIYSAAAWGLLQVADIVFPLLGLPDWSVSLVLIVTAAVFPIVMAISWFYDFSAGGWKTTEPRSGFQLPPLSHGRLLELTLIVTLVLTVGYLYFDRFAMQKKHSEELRKNNATLVAAEPDKSVAVLPFVNMSDDEAHAYFGDGLSEEILNLLAQVKELKVASRTSSFQFKNQSADIREIAQALGVHHVLEGSVRRSGDKIHITAQFIEAKTGYHLWSETYDRRIQDIFSIQDDIARRVVSALQVILSAEAGAELVARSTDNMEAYQLYLRARDYLRQGTSAGNLDNAIELLQRAVAEDPAFASAYAGLCDAYLHYFTRRRDADLFDSAEKNCHRALTRDSKASPVYVALGNLYIQSGQAELASEQFERAIGLSPNLIEAHIGLARSFEQRQLSEQARLAHQRAIDLRPNDWHGQFEMGNFYFQSGRPASAIPHLTRARELAPDNVDVINSLGAAWYLLGDYERAAAAWRASIAVLPTVIAYSNTGSSYYYLGEFEEAVAMYRKAVEISTEDFELWGALGDAYLALGDAKEQARESYAKAIELAETMLRINPSDAEVAALMAYYHVNAGQPSSARASIARVEAMNSDSMYVYYGLALARAGLGEVDAAIADLELALASGYPPELLDVDPGFSSLQALPDYQSMIRRYHGDH